MIEALESRVLTEAVLTILQLINQQDHDGLALVARAGSGGGGPGGGSSSDQDLDKINDPKVRPISHQTFAAFAVLAFL